ncbi:probable serine hydrolase [Sitodiplosis mosellana]|uniref:probable serine hydrolase n=1 Tax=Sitodiplosis mosellana TaxID=263140 RepID=UPI0024440E3C|nr:probable serine hydrolase [Sitodiplosis mosellana]
MFALKNLRIFFPVNSIAPRLISASACKLQNVQSKVVSSKEVEIDVPWGHVAGKWYGSENIRPIVMIHGWQDNAGVFDTLIPLLPSDLSYLAIDLPGHGRSSHLPKGCYYHVVDYVQLVDKIRKHYKWDQISLIAHSMGAIISFIYASVFSANTNLVCALDSLKIQTFNATTTQQTFSWRNLKQSAINEDFTRTPPVYTYDKLVQKIHEGSYKSIDLDKVEYLIERGTKLSENDPNKFYFTRDIRVKFMQKLFCSQSVGLEFVKQVQSPFLFVRGDDRHFAEPEENTNEGVEVFRKHNPQFEMVKVHGTHHLHLNEPELIAGNLSEFLKKYHSQ